MAQPQGNPGSEEPSFTKQLTEWAKDREPDITELVGIRAYTKDGMEPDLLDDIDGRIGTHEWTLINVAARTILRNTNRPSSMILITPSEATLDGRQLKVGEKVDIGKGNLAMIMDEDTLVVYS